MPFHFDNSYARLPEPFYERIRPTPVSAPRLLALADDAYLAGFGVSRRELESPANVAALAGNTILDGANPVALAYAGHQFGNFVPKLGDGRAVLLGEILASDSRRFDLQLKGSGRTSFSRGGDGRAALGPVLRELVVSEAMAALGVPTTRALAAVLTGDTVDRGVALPGAILTRVAASHIRIGTFEYFAARRDIGSLELLVDYALQRHYPNAAVSEGPALALFDAVTHAQLRLVAHWLALGFVHGVMNTDNVTISGETIDYGPCAFLDTYDPMRKFSSIDEQGRYAFANQPHVMLWNLSRLGQALVPLVAGGGEGAVEVLNARLEAMPTIFNEAYAAQMRRKLGLTEARADDMGLVESLLERMAADGVDFTNGFRSLADGEAIDQFVDREAFAAWFARYQGRLAAEPSSVEERREPMRRANPAFIPRNHRVEEMIAAATAGDLKPLERLRTVLSRPYDDQPEAGDLREAPGDEQWRYRTFCGT